MGLLHINIEAAVSQILAVVSDVKQFCVHVIVLSWCTEKSHVDTGAWKGGQPTPPAAPHYHWRGVSSAQRTGRDIFYLIPYLRGRQIVYRRSIYTRAQIV